MRSWLTGIWSPVAILALLAVGCSGSPESRCASLRESDRDRLQSYVRKKFELSALPTLSETSVTADCYHILQFASEDQRPFHMELYLSPDLRYLSRELFDSNLDPDEEERRREESLMAGLTAGNPAAAGPRDAPVTLTVFSDFQCSYCARAARMLNEEVLPLENGTVRFVFRHLPLDFHQWARRAAEASACAQKQSNESFWSLHDFIFENQGDLTVANLDAKLAEHLSGVSGFDLEAYSDCLEQGATAEQIDEDIAFARAHGVSATPTLFVNTHQIKGAGSPEEVRTLIREFELR